ncbi:DUF2971 domain-containing protein [Mesorhizobium sp. M0293]|uniref:DUF2971 domain-containing protein n=1 Tax=unclassified Mesorhizobium TaxID=325217 RepID=UPI00333E1003
MEEHPSFPQPNNTEIKVWRYMDLSKFAALIQSSQLFYARADNLGDKFEGSFPRMNVTIGRQQLADFFRSGSPETSEDKIAEFLEIMSKTKRAAREYIYVNCWHANEAESAAMWRLYAKSSDAVAIQSRYSLLYKQMPDRVYLGEVTYGDYETIGVHEGNTFNAFMLKRDSFAHEREVRSMMMCHSSTETLPGRTHRIGGGMALDVDLNWLLEKIFVSPDAPDWFYQVVSDLSKKYGLAAPVHQSSLASEALF